MPKEQHPFTSNRWLQNINNPLLQDKWFISRNCENQPISFAYMPNKDVSSIFLGSFPIWQIVTGEIGNQNMEFFYGSVVNNFWKCLGSIAERQVLNLNDRLAILDTYKIGITDRVHFFLSYVIEVLFSFMRPLHTKLVENGFLPDASAHSSSNSVSSVSVGHQGYSTVDHVA